MRSGILGKLSLVAGVTSGIYKVADGNTAVIGLNVVNRDKVTNAQVQVAISEGMSPGDADFIEYDVTLMANGGVLERSGLVLGAGETIFVKSDIHGVVVRVFGFEETAVL